jgi:conjugative relaxase-like TrwC/TraI family protein
LNSWATLNADRVNYYQRSVADGRENYYSGQGESPGRYLGEATKLLDLAGELAEGDLANLTQGLHPTTGGRVAERPPRAPYTDSKGKLHEPVLGYDITMSAPKSVSLLYAAGGENSLILRDCHERAVAAAVPAIERKAAIVRRGKDGKERHTPHGLIVAAFTHRTSRAGDPQLHTHCVIPNMAPGPDHRWTALHGPALRDFTHAGGAIYRAELRANVYEALGLQWREVEKGLYELEGWDRPTLREFSKRRVEIERVAQHWSGSAKAMEAAALQTRLKKHAVDWPAIGQYVRGAIGEQRLETLAAGEPAGPVPRAEIDHDRLAGPEGLTKMRNTFRERDLIEAIANSCQQGARRDWILTESARHLERFDAIRIAEDTYTHLDLVNAERARETAQIGRLGERTGLQTDRDIRKGTEGRGLNAEQMRVLQHVFTSGNGVEIIRARAGVGKTRTAAAMAALAAVADRRTIGVAPTARAAAEMQTAGVKQAYTLDELLLRLRSGNVKLGPRDLIVFDEAPMAGTRPAARLEQHAAAARCKLVEIGDDGQLPPVLAGGERDRVHEQLGGLKLEKVMRQNEPREIRRLDLVYAGFSELAVKGYEEDDRLKFDQRPQDAVEIYWQAVNEHPFGEVAFITPTNAIADHLNRLVHADRLERGELGDQKTIGELDLAVGDRVICKRNDRELQVINSDRGTVTGFHGGGATIELDRGGHVRHIPESYALDGDLRLGYASTCHAVQGQTVERTVFAGYPDQVYKEMGYTAFSRARGRTDICILSGEGRDAEQAQFMPVDPDRVVNDRQVLIRTLKESRGPSLAVDEIGRALERGRERGRAIDDDYGLSL